MMKTVAVIVGIGICGALITANIPGVRGPFNRIRNEANEKLNAEYVVDNYKAQYIELHGKREDVLKNLQHFTVEKKVAEQKLAYANDKKLAAKNALVLVGTADMKKFNQLKDQYEVLNTETKNFEVMINTYSNAIVKLEATLNVIETNMSKAKINVATLESKKMLVDSIAAVNSTVENLNSTSDGDLAISVEKLDDNVIRESIKLEALGESKAPEMDKASAEAYIQSLK